MKIHVGSLSIDFDDDYLKNVKRADFIREQKKLHAGLVDGADLEAALAKTYDAVHGKLEK